jgi:putative inorganic carbon (HCO3(-)) transporter
MDKICVWWGKGIFVSLCVSIVLLGIGPLESSLPGIRASAWSVSRTTFFLWLVWKILTRLCYGSWQLGFIKQAVPVPLILFFALVTLSLLPDFHAAGDYRYFFFGSMHYLMIVDLFSNQKKWRLAFHLLALLPGLLAVRGILYDPLVLELDQMRRFGYPLPHPNIAGYSFAITLPLCFAVAVGERGRTRALAGLSWGAQLLALILTYSRGSWLGWCASIFSFSVMLKRWKETWIILTIVGFFLSLAAPLQERLLTLVRPQTDFSINERMQAMEAGLRLGLEYPVLGVGYGRGRLREGIKRLYPGTPTDIARIAHTHNMYIELFAETGLLGLSALLWLLCHAFCRALNNARQLQGDARIFQFGIAASWIAFAVTGLGDVPFFHHEIRILFFTLLALTCLYNHKTLQERRFSLPV